MALMMTPVMLRMHLFLGGGRVILRTSRHSCVFCLLAVADLRFCSGLLVQRAPVVGIVRIPNSRGFFLSVFRWGA